MTSSLPGTPPAPPRKRRSRLLFTIFVLLVVLIALAPWALSSVARTELSKRMTAHFGTPCRIEGLSLGWLSGFEFGRVEIGNAPGFDQTHPLLRISEGRGQIRWLRLFTGRIDVTANVRGLRLWVDENKDGETNLERMADASGVEVDLGDIELDRHGPDARGSEHKTPDPDVAELLSRLRLDLSLERSGFEIRKNGELLESVDGLDCSLQKDEGDQRFRASLDATLPPTVAGAGAGAIHFETAFDALLGTANGTLRSNRFDLARYAPLLRSLRTAGDLTELHGIVDGNVTFAVDPRATPSFTLHGDLTVAGPRFAGALVGGMDLRAEQWTLRPRLCMRDQDAFSAVGSELDLGFLRVVGKDSATADTLAFGIRVDLAALAAAGGPFAGTEPMGGVLDGTVTLPLASLRAGDFAKLRAQWQRLQGIAVQAQLEGARYRTAGLTLAAARADLRIGDGRLELQTAPGTTLNGGPVELRATATAADDGALPFELTVGWRGGHVAGDAAPLLRYAVPLLAGLGDEVSAFVGNVDLDLQLRGPLFGADGEATLQWLDRFEGAGNLTLTEGHLTPAAPLQPLLQLLGETEQFSIDRLTGAFTMREGAITSKATRWLSKGKEYGLTGTAHLDGRLEGGLDLTALLQQHRDGKVIAAVLGDQPLAAGLGGTLDTPTLQTPDLGKLAEDALRRVPRQLLEQQGQELLKQGLESLFGKKKK